MNDAKNRELPALAISIAVSDINDGDSGRRAIDKSFYSWITNDPELRGRARLIESPPRPGTLGAVADTIAVVLAPGGVAAILASAVVSWIRSRRSDVRITLRRPDGEELEIHATQIRGLDGPALSAQINEVRRWMTIDAAPSRAEGSAPPGDRTAQ